ncbi:YeeE/YedE family protein [Rhizobium sp. PDO1-076]|uniref:YeeE/YedE family protein n=1 Tax=Rhizobium sp. PDO1-076 TaxID=1125979 RepID=UPI00055DCF56|nr:membrane protein [Rhizobium sp. PDO1-076]
MTQYLQSLTGGALIGLSAILLLALNGRIAGISGIVGRLVQGHSRLINAAFVVGLMAGLLVYVGLFRTWPTLTITASLPLIGVAGLLVGFGARMGSGCTSGHGVMGLARLSLRSLAAVMTFLATGIITVTLMRGSL